MHDVVRHSLHEILWSAVGDTQKPLDAAHIGRLRNVWLPFGASRCLQIRERIRRHWSDAEDWLQNHEAVAVSLDFLRIPCASIMQYYEHYGAVFVAIITTFQTSLYSISVHLHIR